MTIYTFGDPELLREALLALATIFSLVEWSDPGSAMGLGGNMLAVALIGLLAVAVAGVTSQQVRVDYLLIALVLFGIMFSSNVDVNVEDIQTGNAAVVADVPVGIAMVASAASSAARSLTETTAVALQRPGVTTSVITSSGFMDPLRILYGLRSLSFQELDEYAYKSMLEFYKICIGGTIRNNPTQFDLNEFRTTGNPFGYMLTPANFVNYSVIYYSQADPVGTVMPCDLAAGNIQATIEAMTAGSTEAEAKLRLSMGERLYNTSFDYADLTTAADVITRGTFSGQDFMHSVMMRNFLAVGEAWRLAEYGTNQAQYAATVTGALEEQRVSAATEGTIFLNMMFPLMNFFQFLFFTLAPFIALVVIASPFTSGKTLGMYLLFGVWAYSWMPIAAVIDHYIQISIGNTFVFSDVTSVGVEYTALTGLDDMYNQLANKLVIGSNALAATPVIVGAVLFGTIQGIMSLSKGLAGGASANTSISSPRLAEGRPLVTAGGYGEFGRGTRLNQGGAVAFASTEQRQYYGQAGASVAISSGESVARSKVESAKASMETSRTVMSERLDSVFESGGVFNSQSHQIQSGIRKGFNQAFKGVSTFSDWQGMTSEQTRDVYSALKLSLPVWGVGQGSKESARNTQTYNAIMQHAKENGASVTASFAESISDSYQGQSSKVGELRESVKDYRKNEQEFERARTAEQRVQKQSQAVQSVTAGLTKDGVDIVTTAVANHPDARNMYERSVAKVAGILGSDWSEVQQGAYERFSTGGGGKPIRGIDGRQDENMDIHDQYLSLMLELSDRASNPKAFEAYASLMSDLGVGAGTSPQFDTSALVATQGQDAFGVTTFRSNEEETGKIEDKLPLPDKYSDIRQRSKAARETGSSRPTVPSSSRAGVESAFGQYQSSAVGETFSDDQSGVVGDHHKIGEYISSSLGPTYAANQTLTDLGVEVWGPDSGYTQSLYETVPAALEDPSKIEGSLGRLNKEVNAQLGGLDFRAMDRYEAHLGKGLSPQEALLATYAEVGARQPGFGDYFGGIAGTILGVNAGRTADDWYKAAGRTSQNPLVSKFGWAKIGGATTGLIALGSAGMTYWNAKTDAAEGADFIREAYKEEFRRANPGAADQFDQLADRAKDVRELMDVVVEFRNNGQLTDEMIDSLAPPRTTSTFGGDDSPLHGGKTKF